METTHDQYNKVAEFMNIVSQEVNTEVKIPTMKVAKFRLKLISEELHDELKPAIDQDDVQEILDALCDILYVTYGAIATFGIKAPLYTIKEKIGPVRLPNCIEMNNMYSRITNGYSILDYGLDCNGIDDIGYGLDLLVSSSLEMAYQMNFDLVQAFNEVHNSNLSKFCSSTEEAIKCCEDRYSSGDERYADYNIYVDEVTVGSNVHYIIKRKVDGKVLKGPNYFDPDLSKYLN